MPCPPPGIFQIQGSNPCLPHHRGILYHLSHKLNVGRKEGRKEEKRERGKKERRGKEERKGSIKEGRRGKGERDGEKEEKERREIRGDKEVRRKEEGKEEAGRAKWKLVVAMVRWHLELFCSLI